MRRPHLRKREMHLGGLGVSFYRGRETEKENPPKYISLFLRWGHWPNPEARSILIMSMRDERSGGEPKIAADSCSVDQNT